MAWPDTTSIKDAIARGVEGTADYATSSTHIKNLVDDCYNMASQMLGQYAQLVSQNGTTVPDEWANWVVGQGSLFYAQRRRVERVKQFEDSSLLYMRAFASALQRTAVTASSTTHGTPLTLQQVRRSALSRAFRLDPPLMASVDDVDAAALEAAHDLWTRKDWVWKRKLVKVVVTSESSVAITEKESATAVVPDRLLSRTLQPLTEGEKPVEWMDFDEAAMLRARQDQAQFPKRFRIDRSATGAWVWTFWPEPDQAYSFYTTVVRATPAITTPAEFDAATQLMPTRLQHLLRELAYARLLRSHGRNKEAGPLLDDLDDRINRDETSSDDTGTGDNFQPVRDVYRDTAHFASNFDGYYGGGM